MRARVPLALAALASVHSVWAGTPGWVKALDQQVAKRIQLNGYRRWGLHLQQVSGDRDAYNSLNYYGQGQRRFTDIGQIDFRGRNVFGLFNFDGTILDSRVTDPQGQKFSLDYNKRAWRVNAGDIQGTLLNTNRYASVNKTLRGVQLGYRSGGFAAKTIYSQVRGSARTVSLSGTNSPGPYYLQNNQILRGTERIQLDGVTQVAGTDFAIDYDAGSITFLNRSIPPTSTIVATYEALGIGGKAGTIQGISTSYTFAKTSRVGLSVIQQLARGAGKASTRLEKFQGFGAPSTPYFLQFEPLDVSAVLIRVDGIVQALGVDYTFDAANPAVFYFTRFMPQTSNIDVLYTPKPRSTVDGDREVVGLDYQVGLGKMGNLGTFSAYQSLGRLKNTVTPRSGVARGASLRYGFGKAVWTANVRDVPATFVGVESATFNRNERAHDASVEFNPTPKLTTRFSETNGSIRLISTNAKGNTVYQNSRVTNAIGTMTYRPTDETRWELTHTRGRNRQPSSANGSDTTELTGSHRIGKLDLRLGYRRANGRSAPLTGGSVTRFNLQGLKLGGSYLPSPVLSFGFDLGLSDVKSGGQRSAGRDHDLSINYRPSDKFQLTGRYAISDSGKSISLGGYDNGFGSGYDGNGFSGGGGSSYLAGASNMELFSITSSWQMLPRLRLDTGVRNYRTTGSVTSNARTAGRSVGLSYDGSGNMRASLSLDRSDTTYVGSAQKSGATTTNLVVDGSPAGPWSYSLGLSALHTSGGTLSRQNSQSSYGSLNYKLNPRQALIADFFGSVTNGYLPQTNSDYGLTWQYRIWESLALNVSYRVRNVRSRDPLVQSGAYRSRGFDIGLDMNFSR